VAECNFLLNQSHRPLAAVVFSFALGIAASLMVDEYVFSALVAADICLIIASFVALGRKRLNLSWMLGMAAVASGGLLTALAHRDGFDEFDLRAHLATGAFPLEQPVSFAACVEESEPRGEEILATVALKSFLKKDRWLLCSGKVILGIPKSTVHYMTPQRGDGIRGWATWRIPRDFQNPGSLRRVNVLKRREIFVIGRMKSTLLLEIVPGGCRTPLTELANSAHRRMQRTVKPLQEKGLEQPAAILASLVIGDYSGLNDDTREAFQNSGTLHVLVVSGLHVAWLSWVVLQVLRLARLPERLRLLLTAFLILLYTCIVGFQASISRCLWMFLLYLAGRMILRRADPVNILVAAALILLAIEPDWLFDTGFQLSFLSVMAIATNAATAVNTFLKPLWKPLLHCGDQARLFLEPGFWNQKGRYLRTRCEILIEAIADSRFAPARKIAVYGCRMVATAGLAGGSMVLVTVVVQLWLEPILACSFNRLCWISPLANLVIVPLSSFALACGIAATLLVDVPLIGPSMIDFAGQTATLLLSCANRITMIPLAWERCPTPSVFSVVTAVLPLSVWSLVGWRRLWIPFTYTAALLACLSIGSVPLIGGLFPGDSDDPWPEGTPLLVFTFLDVGEGDSTVITFPDKRIWLVDAGGLRQVPREDGSSPFDIGEAVVSRYLWHRWISRVDRLIVTHPDIDHAGGVPAVMNNFEIGRIHSPSPGPNRIIVKIFEIASEKLVDTGIVYAGMTEQLGPVTVTTLNPPAVSTGNANNDDSIVLRFSFNRFSAILMADLEKKREALLASEPVELKSLLLKVAHHGSRWSTSDLFLERVQPTWAVVSVGRNPFGHPSEETLGRLARRGVRTFLTPDQGAVSVQTDGFRYVIRTYTGGLVEQGILP